ncbi:MAG: hypothetical protein HGB21_02450 [Nitrospirae bacterium]|nr:hypothetical protein [Nitrospirota bacterium]
MAIINTISSNQAQFPFNRVDSVADPAIRQTNAGKDIGTPKNDPVPLQKHDGSRAALGERQTINASLNNAAMSIRTADRTMQTIGGHISSMRAQLDIIVKHYPPFLTTSPERVRALRSFSAFRREIDAMTLPPRNDGAAKIMADPAVFPQAGNQTIAVGMGGAGTLQGQQVHTGPSGLNIPALTDTATDAEVNAAIKSLDAAQTTLGLRRAGLSSDAANLLPPGTFTDRAAEQTSVTVGKSIAQEPSQGVTRMRPVLLQLA